MAKPVVYGLQEDPPKDPHKVGGALLDILAALGSIGAGLYLLTSQAVSPDSYIELLAHGIGVYFIAKGIYMGRTAYLQARMTGYLSKIASRED